MEELFIDNKDLIKFDVWKGRIKKLYTDFNNLETNKNRAKRNVKEVFLNAIKKRINKNNNFGVAFSGGVDSTLIAFTLKDLGVDFTCYAVGLENSQDTQEAKKIANKYGFKLRLKILSINEFERIVKKVVHILDNYDVMKVSVGCVTYAVCEMAKKDGIVNVFTGLGSEEIFAGYQRHEEALQENNFEKLHEECYNGLLNMRERDLVRDFSIGKSFGMDLATPYLDEDLIKLSMKVHPMYKLDKNDKKIILREVAEEIGLDKEFAWRPKKAAQYGSRFIKGIDKLAKKNGFKLKKDYLKSLLE